MFRIKTCAGIQYNGTTTLGIDPYPGGGTLGMLGYAQNDEGCIRSILSPFMDYLPFVLLMQALTLIIVEKFTFRLPRISQNVERFYAKIVEDLLFGNGPDVAEDLTDPKTSTEAIARRRQRKEICVSLKRSSIIHNVYITKNCLEVIFCGFFGFYDVSSAVFDSNPTGACSVDVAAFSGIVDMSGTIYFQVSFTS